MKETRCCIHQAAGLCKTQGKRAPAITRHLRGSATLSNQLPLIRWPRTRSPPICAPRSPSTFHPASSHLPPHLLCGPLHEVKPGVTEQQILISNPTQGGALILTGMTCNTNPATTAAALAIAAAAATAPATAAATAACAAAAALAIAAAAAASAGCSFPLAPLPCPGCPLHIFLCPLEQRRRIACNDALVGAEATKQLLTFGGPGVPAGHRGTAGSLVEV